LSLDEEDTKVNTGLGRSVFKVEFGAKLVLTGYDFSVN